ncbi:MAG TPA: hypothetical protein VKV06_00770 [Acidimicrobiales bacterium]|nr:hypothetical protein [Acidimicrobiales bacterium]
MLVPAGVLVLLLLAAIAVDSAAAYLGQRQLGDELTAAVNDAATAGVSNHRFYGQGTVSLDPSTTAAAVCRSLAAQGEAGLHDVRVAVEVAGPEVTARASARVEAVFGRLVPGFGSRPVAAEATADAEQAPGPPPAPLTTLQPLGC